MLIEMAIGDAYGSFFEGADAAVVRRHNGAEGYAPTPGSTVGRYTDDTQMSLAVAESLIAQAEPWTPLGLAERFVGAYKRDPRSGYARRFRGLLEEVRDGADLLRRMVPKSERSGAAMRAAPIGVLADIGEVKRRAEVQARITHDTPSAIRSAVAAALIPHYFLYGLGHRPDLGRFLESHVEGEWALPWSGPVDLRGESCVHAAVSALCTSDSLRSLLQRCIAFTGDVDTVAAIALAGASCCRDLPNDLPPAFLQHLEAGPFGRRYVEHLDAKLLALVPAHAAPRRPN